MNKHHYGVFALLLWVIFAFLANQLIRSAPPVRMLSSVEIKPSLKGGILGLENLGQASGASSAELAHLWVGQDANQQWLFKNVAVNRLVDAQTERMDTRYVRQWALQTGDILRFKDFFLVIGQADGDALEIHDDTHLGRWDGHELLLDGQHGYDACEGGQHVDTWKNAFKWAIKDITWLHEEVFLFSLGGQIHCAGRWAHPELATKAVRFYWDDGRYWVRADNNIRFIVERGNQKTAYQDLTLPLNGEDGQVTRVILGRTYYRVGTTANGLSLTPFQNISAFKVTTGRDSVVNPPTPAATVEQTAIHANFDTFDWIGAAVLADPWRRLSWVALGIALAISGILTLVFRWRLMPTLTGGLLLWAAVAWHGEIGMALALLFLSGMAATLSWQVRQRLTGQTGVVWLLFTVLLVIGALSLTQLGAGADNTRWLRFAGEFLWVTTAFLSVLLIISGAPPSLMVRIWALFCDSESKTIKRLKLVGLIVLSLMLVSQLLLGSEIGVGGFQPVEFAKLAIILLAAQALFTIRELRIRLSKTYLANRSANWASSLFLIALFFLFATGILTLGVSDYSPFVIISAILAVYLWELIPNPVSPSQRQLLGRKMLFGVALLIVITAAGYLYLSPPTYDSGFPQAERLRVWSDPYRYAEAADQLLKGFERIAEGGLWGTGWFGTNGNVMSVPALQNDFILVFLINRFGVIAALVLLVVQVFWLTVLINLCRQLAVLAQHKNFSKARCYYVTSFILLGLAGLHAVHWGISWCNALGLLPIMGQPLTWLSAGTSHLIAIALPTVLLALMASRLTADDQA